MNDTYNLENKVLSKFSGYQTRIFRSKSVILIVLCLVLTNIVFSKHFTQWFKANIPIILRNIFHIILFVILCPWMLNLERSVCNIFTQICVMITKYDHHGKNSRLRRLQMVIFVKIFLFKRYDSWKNQFYGAVLSRQPVTIELNTKPIILSY